MNVEPSQTSLAKRSTLSKLKECSCDIITDVGEMRWDGVSSTTEVDIVRKVEGLVQEL